MSKLKNNENTDKSPLILINRYNPSDIVSINYNYKPIIEKHINYVEELPPFIYNCKTNRCHSTKSLTARNKNRRIEYFENFDNFKIKPSMLYKSRMKISDIEKDYFVILICFTVPLSVRVLL